MKMKAQAMKLVLDLLLGSVKNKKLVCTSHRLQPLEVHRDIAPPLSPVVEILSSF